jgi:L-2-hydroxyglutarate oxidase LhgO
VKRYRCDVLIIGGGVVGLSAGIAFLESDPSLKVVIAEKGPRLGLHASGRNSGVLHAGFYYSPDSLKARFCRDGNQELRSIAEKYNIPVREVGKVVVARNDDENERLETLFRRGVENGVELEILDVAHLSKYESLAITHERFLWSPKTAISDPSAILKALQNEFELLGGSVFFQTKISLKEVNNEIFDDSLHFDAELIVNAAGAQADRISRSVGVGIEYAMLPFMGVYRATEEKNLPLQRLVYPVPHPINPFLGVHFTLTLDGKVKIGPTAIPIAGREQYTLFSGWSGSDMAQSIKGMASLVRGDAHDFGRIIKSEWPKIIQKQLVKESLELVPSAASVQSWHRKPPGIRAQLVHLPTGKLEQDFVVEKKLNSIHVLNAVSPGWTSALPFGRYIRDFTNM